MTDFTLIYKNKRYDESKRSTIVSNHIGSNHHSFKLDYDDILCDIDKIILNYDEPYADPSTLPTYFLSKQASSFIKVALTGDGGDEAFGGYNKYLLHTLGSNYFFLTPIKFLIYLFRNSNNFFRSIDSKSTFYKLKKILLFKNLHDLFTPPLWCCCCCCCC